MSAERAAFMSMGDSSDFLKKPEKNNSSGGNKSKTTRLTLDLFEPDEFKFPEFNYSKLVQIEKKKQKKIAKLPTNGINNDDPFGNGDDADVERITRELEAKYGTGSAYSKTSKLSNVDRGAGYDISDSFIDDTEAYDELIPDEVETDRGGFYINSGALEFKKLSNFERPGDELIMPKAKKRAFSSTSESSDSENEEKSPSKSKKKSKIEKKAKIAGASSSDEHKAKKAKKDKSPKEPAKDEKKKESEKSVKTTTVKDMLRAKRDMCLKEQGKTSSGTATTTDNDEDGTESTSSLAVSESSLDSHQENNSTTPTNGSTEHTLPSNLPNDITQMIQVIQTQQAAVSNNTKSVFFENHILDKLVSIDNATKAIGAKVRMQVFVYLEKYVPCSSKALFEKVKKHRVSLVTSKFKSEVDKLRRIVIESMPQQQTKFDQDMQMYETKKIISDTPVPTPKKRYHWNDTSRLVLSDINQKIEDLHKVTRGKKDSLREFMLAKFEEHLIPLWPHGWVKIDDFEKEIERKKRKDEKAKGNQSLPKTNTSTNVTNGKTQQNTQKTENIKIQNDVKQPSTSIANGKIPTPSVSPSLQVNTASATSVIKRSSDHSISSIIASSASPSPPMKTPEISKPKVIELDKFSNPSDLLKVTHQQQQPSKVTEKRSDSSDSDCIEIVGEFGPQKTSPSNHNNNRINQSPSPSSTIQQQNPKKAKYDTNPNPDVEFSEILKGLQSLTDTKKSKSLFDKDSVSSNHRKSETSSHVKTETNGINDHFLNPNHSPNKSQNNNVNYSIGDLIAMSRGSYDGSVVQGKLKSSDHKSSHFYNHQQQLNSSTNNNLHSISLSLTPPQGHSTSVSSSSSTNSNSNHNNYSMPSILNLSNRK